ncbi:MAG: hypothetical protein QME28_05265 [Candidatus Saccharicenans sp.]|nr:hypothetical protein [Candidatus Saccharicenans sp.]
MPEKRSAREARGRLILIIILLAAFFALLPSTVLAQIYFGITPIRFELKARPGSQVTEVIYVRNNSSKPIRIKVYAENWFLGEDGSRNFIGNRPALYSVREWVRVNPFDFRLQPEEVKSVRFTVSVPAEAAPGGYHLAVSFEQVPDAPAGGRLGQVAFTGKIVAAVYVTIGKPEIQGQLEDLVFESSQGQQLIKLKITNSGRYHFRLKGEVVVKNAEGKRVVRLEIPDEPVLPESRRWLELRLQENLKPGDYTAEAILDIGRDELLGLKKEFSVR